MAENYLYAGSWLDDSGRAGGGIHRYQIKENGEFRAASWDEALDTVAAGLRRNMGRAGFFTSARCTNEENYLMQRFAREVMSTNNVDHCAHL